METSTSLPYHEPTLISLLTLSSIFLALNVLGSVFDHLLSCGLIVQVLISIAYGQPGVRWLPLESQRVFVDLGYIGLILIVFSGGVSTDIKSLRQNAGLSIAVAATGVLVPIALSFALFLGEGGILGHGTVLQAFAAGAALCSTSLGTTFEVLKTSGLERTRLGAVVASAALLDDVVGLVMVRIITSLGAYGGNIEPAVILRPALVSAGFSVVVPLVCWLLVAPGRKMVQSFFKRSESKEKDPADKQTMAKRVVVSWWTALQDEKSSQSTGAYGEHHNSRVGQVVSQSLVLQPTSVGVVIPSSPSQGSKSTAQRSATVICDTYYTQIVDYVLKPLFFASIGFSIPITQLFAGGIVWRGILYTILMIIGKLLCGLWLVTFPFPAVNTFKSLASSLASKFHWVLIKVRRQSPKPKQNTESMNTDARAVPIDPFLPEQVNAQTHSLGEERTVSTQDSPAKPVSLYPAAVMGCAMVARGEIGFLISSMAESQGVFRRPDEDSAEASEQFLVVTWAIFVCTIVGPLAAGVVVKRIKNLESTGGGSRRNVLGAWGVG
ncbi:Sodium/hydrogen exchanger family-domain-containing protein [Xylariaceae sp. FL1019]|nr:Sodium/hydrogen exchanger family-domain-containing protein [Xylariaceae sp. FL1019]